jgi:hypothetical protein
MATPRPEFTRSIRREVGDLANVPGVPDTLAAGSLDISQTSTPA